MGFSTAQTQSCFRQGTPRVNTQHRILRCCLGSSLMWVRSWRATSTQHGLIAHSGQRCDRESGAQTCREQYKEEAMKPARTRIAPSPTGHMHLGTARTALYDYLLAKKSGGQFILRIEDTDVSRTVPGAEQEIIDGLRWLGLNYDEGPDVSGSYGPYRQTERREIYRAHAKTLVDEGHAYPCFCTPERLEKVCQEQQKRKENPYYDGT